MNEIRNAFAGRRLACKLRALLAVLVVAVGLATTPQTTWAQAALYGSLTGNVTDSSGAVIAGAAIEATLNDTGISTHAVANKNGMYQIEDLNPGTYTVTISAASFEKEVRTGIPVTVNNATRVDVQLRPGSVGQTFIVNASAAPLQTETADVNFQLSTKEITELPSGSARNFEFLFETLPGFSTLATSHSNTGNPSASQDFNVNGLSESGNITLIDGASDVYQFLPSGAAYIPPLESISSVNVVTNSFNADQGVAGGSIANVTIKSGTDSFHGAAWEYNQISALEAKPYFTPAAVAKTINNQFGLNLGGPIIKHKLFFFVDWERLDNITASSLFQSVPTDALRQGNFAGTGTTIYDPATGTSTGTGRTPFPNDQIPSTRISSAASMMAALIPEPNIAGTVSNDYFISQDVDFLRDNIDAKVDYHPTERSTFFAHYTASPSSIYAPLTLGAAGGTGAAGDEPGNTSGLIQLVALGATHTFTPNFVIDGTLVYTRLNLVNTDALTSKDYGSVVLGIPGTNGSDPFQGGYPYFKLSGFTSMGDTNHDSPFLFDDNQYEGNLNLHWVKGPHLLSFGGTYIAFGINNFQPGGTYGPSGGFSFTGGLTALKGGATSNMYNSWADFLLGDAEELGKSYAYYDPIATREKEYALYAEDRWQLRPNLTINYGIRYELYPYAHSDHFGGITYDPTNNNVYIGGKGGVPGNPGVDTGHGYIVPRVGLAYRIGDKTVVRAGFGITIDPMSFQSMGNNYPLNLDETYTGANSYSAAGTLTTGIPALVDEPSLSQGSFQLPTSVGTDFYAKDFDRGHIDSYNLTIQRELPWSLDWQVGYVGDRVVRENCEIDLNASGPGSGVAGEPLYQLFGNSNTIDQYTPACPGNYNSLQTRLNRRVGNGAQAGVTYTYSKAMGYGTDENTGFDFQWAPVFRRNYALLSTDRTNVFTTHWIYNVPFGKGQAWLNRGIVAAIAGGWQAAGILTWESGTPFTVTSSSTSLDAEGSSQTANQMESHVAVLGVHAPGYHYFDPNAFAAVTTATFGTAGINTVRGPGLFNIDANLKRTFAISERFKLQISATAFGLTNTPQFANPGADVSNGSFVNGAISSYGGYDTVTGAGGNRSLLLGGKFEF